MRSRSRPWGDSVDRHFVTSYFLPLTSYFLPTALQLLSPNALPNGRNPQCPLILLSRPTSRKCACACASSWTTTSAPQSTSSSRTAPTAASYVRTIVELREKAKAQGLWNPHLPPEWDGMGLGADGDGVRLRRGGPHGHRPVRHQRAGARRGQHAHAAALGDARAEGALPAPARRGQGALVLRDDRAGGRRLGPDADPDEGREGRRRLGDQRPQVVHLRRARARTSRSSSPARTRTPTRRRRATPPSSSTCPPKASRSSATSRRWPGAATTARSASTTCACPTTACSAAAARATCSGSTASARRGSRTACAGSATPRSRSRC